MSSQIAVRVDVANPGQYFACCGLLELAHRMWPTVEGYFDENIFRLGNGGRSADLMRALRKCDIANTMTKAQQRRRDELGAMGQKLVKADAALEAEKKELDARWRESPVVLGEPFGIRVDWFLDDRSGGKSFKTWAGQQSIIDIVTDLQRMMPLEDSDAEGWLNEVSSSDCVPLNFDSDLGGAGADVDIGFSFDPLKSSGLRVGMRPSLELLAFLGLQRFRPADLDGLWEYGVWDRPASVELAALASCGAVRRLTCKRYRFQLLYRTKYLKSFLPGRRM